MSKTKTTKNIVRAKSRKLFAAGATKVKLVCANGYSLFVDSHNQVLFETNVWLPGEDYEVVDVEAVE